MAKRYPDGFEAVKHSNVDIADREFMILVGPSGCGKSTALRMVAGLEEISEGRLVIGDQVVTNVVPKNRDTAMVFQNYALSPHMTVRDMGFGLKIAKRRSQGDRRARPGEARRSSTSSSTSIASPPTRPAASGSDRQGPGDRSLTQGQAFIAGSETGRPAPPSPTPRAADQLLVPARSREVLRYVRPGLPRRPERAECHDMAASRTAQARTSRTSCKHPLRKCLFENPPERH